MEKARCTALIKYVHFSDTMNLSRSVRARYYKKSGEQNDHKSGKTQKMIYTSMKLTRVPPFKISTSKWNILYWDSGVRYSCSCKACWLESCTWISHTMSRSYPLKEKWLKKETSIEYVAGLLKNSAYCKDCTLVNRKII